MTRQESLIIIFIIILLIGNMFFGGQYFYLSKQLKTAKQLKEIQEVNEKVLNFGKLFLREVLRSENEIGFEKRLILENSVRSTGNEKILTSWQKFIESKTESEAQKNVKDLLEEIIDGIYIK